jgi:ribose transport system substrate-binding protein
MAKAAAQVGLKVLEGAGPKINQIIWAPYLVDRSNLSKVIDKSWSQTDNSDIAPNGIYLTNSQIAQFFTHPELGPQSAQ